MSKQICWGPWIIKKFNKTFTCRGSVYFFFFYGKTLLLGKTFFFFWVTWLLSIPSQVFLCTTSCSRVSNLLTDDRKATRGLLPSCPCAGLTGVSACNYILTEVYSGKGQQQHMKACQTSNRALLTSWWYSHRHARGWSARPGMPSFDAGRDFVAQLNISWPFQLSSPPFSPFSPFSPFPSSLSALLSLYTNSCAPSFPPFYWCHREISLTDSLQQMVPQCPSGILHTGFNNLFFTHAWMACAPRAIHADFFFLWSYTNK